MFKDLGKLSIIGENVPLFLVIKVNSDLLLIFIDQVTDV